MSTSTYEHILQELAHLTPAERQQLRSILNEESPGARFVSMQELRQILAQPQPPDEHGQAAVRIALRRIQKAASYIGQLGQIYVDLDGGRRANAEVDHGSAGGGGLSGAE